jgi:hypothetical protein
VCQMGAPTLRRNPTCTGRQSARQSADRSETSRSSPTTRPKGVCDDGNRFSDRPLDISGLLTEGPTLLALSWDAHEEGAWDMNALASAGLSVVGALLYFLIRARKRRPRDEYKEALRELSGPREGFEPIEPEGDAQQAFDRVVDQAAKGLNLVHAVFSALIVGVVVYLTVVDSVTRIVVLITLAVLGAIWVVGKRAGK